MTAQEAFDFLGEGTRTGHLATVRADGRPHVKPIWYVLEGTAESFVVLFTTWHESVAGRNLARDGRAALSVDAATPPYSFVIVQGTVDLVDDPELLRDAATRLGGRYMGRDRAAEYGARNGVAGEYLVRLTPARVTAEKDLAD